MSHHTHLKYLKIIVFFLYGLSAVITLVQAERLEIDISGQWWRVVRDTDAGWISDIPFLPPVDIGSLPVNQPTWGWEGLASHIEATTTLPATVEQFFWGANGNTEGVAGDYRGVSWWSTTVELPESISGRKIFLDFESVRLRAEVFVNRQLTGYDTIGETPFCVDITAAVKPGEVNEIAVRITDPLGNFTWDDRQVMHWGATDVPASHGFGGITGRVILRAVDPVFIDDIWVRNTSDLSTVVIETSVVNTTGTAVSGVCSARIVDPGDPLKTMWRQTVRCTALAGSSVVTLKADCPSAEVWDIDHPNLYTAEVSFTSADTMIGDSTRQRFGFRWFDVKDVDGDRRFSLNGKRIVLLGGMSWGFWPVTGSVPSREMAEREVMLSKEMGLNYMNFHRAIGQTPVMDVADERGFLIYEEPGGYSCEGADRSQNTWREWRRIKLHRMVKRDRSRPSVIIYNLQNRTPNPRTDEDVENMRAAHELDPDRIITFISGFWTIPPDRDPSKHVFYPNESGVTDHGWFDMHNHAQLRSYADACYRNPRDYALFAGGHEDEIVFWGEDGNVYSPPRVQLIKERHDLTGEFSGWQVDRFLRWFDAYDRFLDESGWRRFFPDVDAFTRSMGNTTLYYHGRIIENVRMGNTGDAYTVNGWAAPRLTNQSEIADLYRNPSGDTSILARYCRPLYIAVKIRDKVVPCGTASAADVFIINESGLKGSHRLELAYRNGFGDTLFTTTIPVAIQGGEQYGQPLAEGITLPASAHEGYHYLDARLLDLKGNSAATGSDELFTIRIGETPLPAGIAVIDTANVIIPAAGRIRQTTLASYSPLADNFSCIVLGSHKPNNTLYASILSHVAAGATVVILDNTEEFASLLAADDYQALSYNGAYRVGAGKLIAGEHPLLEGLPQRQACNWEYQVFNRMDRNDSRAILISGGETVIAAVSGNRLDVGAVLTVIPFMRGQIILTTMPITAMLRSYAPQASTALKLFENMLRYRVLKSDTGN